MTRVVLLGLSGDSAIWMVDLDQKTVAQVPQDAADKIGLTGRPIMKGVDYAVLVEQNAQVAAGKFDTVELSSLA